jgi:competence protein ComEC
MRTSFYIFIGGFVTGVLCRSLGYENMYGLLALLFGALCVCSVSVLVSLTRHVQYILLFVCVFLFGVVRTEFAFNSFLEGVQFREGEEASFTGVITQEPDERDGFSFLTIQTVVSDASETSFRVKVPQYPTFQYGDVVTVEGVVKKPESFETENGRTFNYAGYLMKDGIHYELRNADVQSTGENTGNTVKGFLYTLKNAWVKSVSQLIPEPEASLAAGVIVGAKRSLGDEWLEKFRDTGIVHIIVLSGYNLTLIANTVVRSVSFLPHVYRLLLGSLGVACFAVMVGTGATVVRASVMAVLGMLAAYSTRPYVLLRALLFAGFLMVLWNPFVLVHDTGFQLSFMATAGLIFLAPYFETKFTYVPKKLELRAIVSATLATQAAVLPLLMYHMGVVSLIAPLVNVLVLPLMPLTMLVGFVFGCLGLVSIPTASFFNIVLYAPLHYTFLVVDIFSALPFSVVRLPLLPVWAPLLFYGVCVVWIIKKSNTESFKK